MKESVFLLSKVFSANDPTVQAVQKSFDELIDLVTSSGWSQSVFKDNYRNKANFQSADLIALDIDSGMTIKEAQNIFQDYKCIIATTKSHQKIKHKGEPSEQAACDRFRIILFLSERVTDAKTFEKTWQSLAKICPAVDQSTKDASRFWYQSPSVVYKNDAGCMVDVVHNIEDNFIAFRDSVQTAIPKEKLQYSIQVQEFINSGAPAGEWNSKLFIVASNLKDCNYTYDEAIRLLKMPTTLPGNKGMLDQADLATIKSAFSRPPSTGKSAENSYYNQLIDDYLLNDSILWPFMRFTNKHNHQVIYRYTQRRGIKTVVSISCRESKEIAQLIYNLKDRPDVKESIEALRKFINSRRKAPMSEFEVVGRIYDRWLLRSEFSLDKEPSYVTFDPKEVSFLYFDENCIQSGPTPAWDQFLNRLNQKCPDNAETFLAWIWAIFEPKNNSRQVLWLRGDGFDGKSVISNVLGRLIGDSATTINKDSYENRFFYSQVYGKRLVVYGDCKNTKLIKTEKIHSITGGDLVTVEYKNHAAFSGRIFAKVLVCSNESPDVSDAINEQSRMLYLEVAPNDKELIRTGDSSWENQLLAEQYHVLYRAREAYKKLCPKHGQIAMSAAIQSFIDDNCGDTEEELINRFFKNHLNFSANYKISPIDLNAAFRDFYYEETKEKPTNFVITKLKNKLKEAKGVINQRISEDGTRNRYYVGCKLLSFTERQQIDPGAKLTKLG